MRRLQCDNDFFLIKHLVVFILLLVVVNAHSGILSSANAATAAPDHSSLMYQERYAYTLLLFEAIARKSPDVVGSETHQQAEMLVRTAKKHFQQGDLVSALAELNAVISLLETESTQRPPQQREEQRYLSLLEGLPYFKSAYQRHYQTSQAQSQDDVAFGYDVDLVESQISAAKRYADDRRFGEGAIMLRSAQEKIAAAIKRLLDHTQIGVIAYPATSSIVLGRSPQEIAKDKYDVGIKAIRLFREAHKRQHQVEAFDVIGYDAELVDWLLAEATELADEKRYLNALKVVEHVRSLITKALRDTLNGQEIVVELDISTPELEFAYEHRRYQGYEELIPIAIERMRPDSATHKLMSYYVEQGQRMEKQALVTAEILEYPKAISMVLDATRAMQMALRTLGVPIYDSR